MQVVLQIRKNQKIGIVGNIRPLAIEEEVSGGLLKISKSYLRFIEQSEGL